MAQGRREAHKQRTREALREAAWGLFASQGYDDTSVVAIAAHVGVSERTFYRYFESKEAVLFAGWRDQLDAFTTFVRGRPPDEPILRTLEEYSQGWALSNQAGLERARELRAISDASATVRDYERTRVFEVLRTHIIELLGERLGVDPSEDPRPPLLAGLFIEILVVSKRAWLAEGGSLLTHVHDAWASLRALFG